MTQPKTIAVLDIGKTNVKAVLFDGETDSEMAALTKPNRVRQDGPYPHFDVAAIQGFFVEALRELRRGAGRPIDAISITAHGATGAWLGPEELALPVLDYEYAGPDALAAEYDSIRPAFEESCSPRLPGGLNLGAQLYWQATAFPAAVAGAAAFVTYPQFWSWWLTGVAANEPTSLGAHTDLWAPREGRFSSLVSKAGWTAKMAPLRSAFDVLGPVRPALAARIGLDRRVPVTCGIHDSNASLLPHLRGGGAPRAIVSTGTWAIVFAVGGSLDALDADRDTLANVDAYGRATPSARFMGGREFDILTDKAGGEADEASAAAVLIRGIMALPTFAPGNGPFPKGKGRWSHDPAGLTRSERVAVASLYVAMMTATCLGLLRARGVTVIEGPFARNTLYREALAALTGRLVVASPGSTGTSAGAALLARPRAHPHQDTPLGPPRYDLKGLQAYAAQWKSQAGT